MSLRSKLTLGLGTLDTMDVRRMLSEIYATLDRQDSLINGLKNEIRKISEDRPRPSKTTRGESPSSAV